MENNTVIGYKICTKCKINKNIEKEYLFSKSLNKLSPSCKACNLKTHYEKVKRKSLEPIKKCSICSLEKEMGEYYKSQPYNCKDCINAKNKNLTLEERQKYNKRQKEYHREYRKNPHIKEKRKLERQKYRNKPHLVEKRRLRKIKIEQQKIDTRNKVNEKRRNCVELKIRVNLSRRINAALKEQRKKKNLFTIELLGCDIKFFIQYIQSKFYSQDLGNGTVRIMTMSNYGKNGWELDHIIPCAAFQLTKEEEQRKCFHYTNIQPLWQIDNRQKNDILPSGKRARNNT